MNLRRKHCITVWALKCSKRFLPVCWSFMKSTQSGPSNAIKDFFHFAEASWKVKNKMNLRRKHCITVWALKCYKRFLPVCWSFMKSKKQNQFLKKTLHHSMGTLMLLQISSCLLKLQEKSRTKSMWKETMARNSIQKLSKFKCVGDNQFESLQ